MPTKNSTYHFKWEELINSAGNDGIHCKMEEIKFEVPK